jgi:sulfotransferase family protein
VGLLPSASFNLPARLFRGLDRVADRLGLFRRPVPPEKLVDLARRRSGLDDFGGWSFEEPLAVLLRSYYEEANLSTFGRIAVRWDMLRFLSNLLRLRDEEKRDPAVLDERIDRPIFVLGLPRSGTTFLHNLLADDPGNLTPRCWQTVFPYPIWAHENGSRDRRPELTARQYSQFLMLAPELPSLHPLDAHAAQECIEITGHVFRSLRFDTTHYIPSFQQWLEDAGHLEAYRFHKRFLQHLQHQNGGGQWILKSPDHIFALEALCEVYPDARFVFVHRDPMKVLPSVARLTEILRQPFTRRIDRLQIGRQVSNRWELGSKLLIDAADWLKSSPERIVHVRYRDLVRDPFAIVTDLYRHFGMTLSGQGEHCLKRSIAKRPDGGYGRNSYRFEDYGLNPAAERKHHSAYMAHFRMQPEEPSSRAIPDSSVRLAV